MPPDYHPLFPYNLRKGQNKIMSDIRSCLEEGTSFIFQASTGSGKTICVLAPSLEYAEREEKKILYLTRTNSQQKQVLLELKKIGGHIGMGLQGRNNNCLLTLDDEELKKGDADELSKYCSDRKKEVRKALAEDEDSFSCKYYAGLLNTDMQELRSWIKDYVPTIDEFRERCHAMTTCPYEASKVLVSDAILVTAPYIYFFMPFIRRRLLEWMGVEMDELIVIVDEAHNLPDYARELSSGELSIIGLERAVSEGSRLGDPALGKDITVSELVRVLTSIIYDISSEFIVEDDGLIPPNEVRSELMYRLGINSNEVKGIVKELKLQGELVQERKRDEKKLPRSYLNSIADFLTFWMGMERSQYIKLVNGGSNPSIEGYCLDPSLVTEALNHCHSSIHMSGTLEPLKEYRDSVGLPFDTEAKKYPSPFPSNNISVFYTKKVTTKYEVLQQDKSMLNKISEQLWHVLDNLNRNTVVFFPSYRMMEELVFPLSTTDTFVEAQRMPQRELMQMVEEFKKKGGVLFSVIGGRLSEGMDFPGDELEVAIVVGVPYPKPTARQRGLQHYYDMKFGKGWEYTVKAPAVRKILQASGRLVRSETDLGAVLLMDERAVHFKKFLPSMKLTQYPLNDIKGFFETREKGL